MRSTSQRAVSTPGLAPDAPDMPFPDPALVAPLLPKPMKPVPSSSEPDAPVVEATAVHEAALRVLVEGMIRLGLLTGETLEEALESGSYRAFYMHQTSHWLGLDVHDVGLYKRGDAAVKLEPGVVLTIEPGLYIAPDAEVPEPYRGIGIRIEDDVLVTDYGREILTRGVPVDPDEIERLVGAG